MWRLVIAKLGGLLVKGRGAITVLARGGRAANVAKVPSRLWTAINAAASIFTVYELIHWILAGHAPTDETGAKDALRKAGLDPDRRIDEIGEEDLRKVMEIARPDGTPQSEVELMLEAFRMVAHEGPVKDNPTAAQALATAVVAEQLSVAAEAILTLADALGFSGERARAAVFYRALKALDNLPETTRDIELARATHPTHRSRF